MSIFIMTIVYKRYKRRLKWKQKFLNRSKLLRWRRKFSGPQYSSIHFMNIMIGKLSNPYNYPLLIPSKE